MATALVVAAYIFGILLIVIIILSIQHWITPRLLLGTLSEPLQIGVCTEPNGDKTSKGKATFTQDCQVNSLTGFGCLVNGPNGQYITKKTIMQKIDCDLSSSRHITREWVLVGEPTACVTTGQTCCQITESCNITSSYRCAVIGDLGGENRCTPSYLPGPFPTFDPNSRYDTVPAVVSTGCRNNYCRE